MAQSNSVLALWSKLAGLPGGKWLFSRLICFKAPYFSSVRPTFVALRSGYCEVTIPKRRAVTNHLGTVHAIAMCNMAELAAGIMSEASVPASHRWIPKGMSVDYLKKAGTSLRAIAEVTPLPEFGAAFELPVTVNVMDRSDVVVCRAVVRMWVSPKKEASRRTD